MARTTKAHRVHLEVMILHDPRDEKLAVRHYTTACGQYTRATKESWEHLVQTIYRGVAVAQFVKDGSWRNGWHPSEVSCKTCRRTNAWKALWWLHNQANRERHAVELDRLFSSETFEGMGTRPKVKAYAEQATIKDGVIRVHDRRGSFWITFLENGQHDALAVTKMFRAIIMRSRIRITMPNGSTFSLKDWAMRSPETDADMP